MGADLRPLAQDRRIEVVDHAAGLPDLLHREGEEAVGGGAPPALVGRREVGADVAIGERAEYRIGEGMEHDVGVGMADEAARMGDLDATEGYPVARSEGVDVVADADAHVAGGKGGLGGQAPVGIGEILRRGELHVAGFARHGDHGDAGPFGHGGVVGDLDPGRRRAPVCVADRGEAEALGRLGAGEVLARHGLRDGAVGADALQRIGDRHHGEDRIGRVQRADDAGEERRARKGPGGILDEHFVRVQVFQGGEPVEDRLLAAGAAMDRLHQLPVLRCNSRIAPCIVGVNDGHDPVDGVMGEEGVERVPQQGDAAKLLILLRNLGARDAGPAAGGDDDGGIGHGPALNTAAGRRGNHECGGPCRSPLILTTICAEKLGAYRICKPSPTWPRRSPSGPSRSPTGSSSRRCRAYRIVRCACSPRASVPD